MPLKTTTLSASRHTSPESGGDRREGESEDCLYRENSFDVKFAHIVVFCADEGLILSILRIYYSVFLCDKQQ